MNDENSAWAGWEVATVMSPTGNAAGYSVVTIDHFTTLSGALNAFPNGCLLYTSPSPRDLAVSRMPSSA